MVYVAAYAPGRGESLKSLGRGKPPTDGEKAIRPDRHGFVIIGPAAFPSVFAADVPAEQGRALAAHQLPLAASVFEVKAEVAAWHDKPTFYAISATTT